MKELRIESGLPIPEKKGNGKWISIVAEMKLGDSVLCQEKWEANALKSKLKRAGFGTVSRSVSGGFRVWKIKK